MLVISDIVPWVHKFDFVLRLHSWTVIFVWVLLSDLSSARLRCLAQHGETSQVLNSISLLGKLLVERDIQGEHQRFHFVSHWTLQNSSK